jgi:hypothetical protein
MCRRATKHPSLASLQTTPAAATPVANALLSRESDEVSLINLTLMESFVANLKISQRKLAERIKV